jgi:tRNA A-37 threonylcarbamoyl transferase component Bud32
VFRIAGADVMLEIVRPERLGRYEIERELGKGAMGVVYLARDPVIGRQVALKTFAGVGYATELEARRAHRRFIREAESAGVLSHPNIVTIYDVVGDGPRGSAFIAMEYVEGENLAHWIGSRTEIRFAELGEIITQAAEGIDYAHGMGVVHRDIKPANLLIAAGLRVKIADFGIAKLTTSHLTLEPEVFGTPNYMPPEVMEGKAPDYRSDIYALGVVAYELLTGRTPFAAPTLAGVVLNVVRGACTPAENLVAALPKGTSEVLARAMDRDPAARYSSAREFAHELTAVLAGVQISRVPQPVLTGTAALQGPTRRIATGAELWRELRWRALAARWGAFLALLLLLAIGAQLWLRRVAGASPPDPGDRVRAQYLEALHEGVEARASGDAAKAGEQFARAQALFPLGSAAPRLRAAAEAQARDSELAARRAAVRAALDARDYAGALAAARRLLELGPGEVDTRALLFEVEQGLARASPIRPARPTAVTLAAAPVATAAASPPETEAAPARPAAPISTTVDIALETEAEDGVLVIYAGDHQVVRMSFDAYRRAVAVNPSGALLRVFPPERVTFRVYAALARQPARLATVEADLTSGARRRLVVKLPTDHRVRAALE